MQNNAVYSQAAIANQIVLFLGVKKKLEIAFQHTAIKDPDATYSAESCV